MRVSISFDPDDPLDINRAEALLGELRDRVTPSGDLVVRAIESMRCQSSFVFLEQAWKHFGTNKFDLPALAKLVDGETHKTLHGKYANLCRSTKKRGIALFVNFGHRLLKDNQKGFMIFAISDEPLIVESLRTVFGEPGTKEPIPRFHLYAELP
jgi:hypothetical protein